MKKADLEYAGKTLDRMRARLDNILRDLRIAKAMLAAALVMKLPDLLTA